MATKKQIEEFIAAEPIAVAGVSRNTKKFGYTAFKEVREKGLNVIPINPNTAQIDGNPCYANVDSLPANVKSLWILTRKDQTAGIVRVALDRGIRNIWIQQMSESPEALELLKGKDINLITKQCLLMHYKPHGFHKFHRSIKGLFGMLPK